MARIFTTGAEELDAAAVWDNIYSGWNGTEHVQAHGATEVLNFSPRTGLGIWYLGNGQSLRKDFPNASSHTSIYVGFAIRVAKAISGVNAYLMYLHNNNDAVYTYSSSLYLDSSGCIKVYRGGTLLQTSVAGVIQKDVWHYIEWFHMPRNTSGSNIVRVDGIERIAYSGDTTDDKEYVNSMQIQGWYSDDNAAAACYDDIVVNDQNGTVNNSWPGQVRLMPIHPIAAGSRSGWSRAGVNLGSDLAQVRSGSFDFAMLQTAGTDQLQSFDAEVPDLPDGASIKNVIVSARARVQSGSGVIAPLLKSSANEVISADQNLDVNWKYKQYAWAKNPVDDQDWAEDDLANIEIGISS